MDGCPPEHGRNFLADRRKWHDRMGFLFRGVGQFLQGRECVLVTQIQDLLVGLNDLEIESSHLIEKDLIGSKPRGMLWLVMHHLPDGRGCFGCHGCFLFVSFIEVHLFYLHDTSSCIEKQGLKPQSPDHGLKSRGLWRSQTPSFL